MRKLETMPKSAKHMVLTTCLMSISALRALAMDAMVSSMDTHAHAWYFSSSPTMPCTRRPDQFLLQLSTVQVKPGNYMSCIAVELPWELHSVL